MLRSLALTLPLFTLAAVGCASTEPDELSGEAEDLLEGKADSGGVYTYFDLSKDFRKCSFPLCGGFYLDRLNASKTTCHDNSSKTTCYTPELDWSEAGLTADQQAQLFAAADLGGASDGTYAIVRGRFAKKNLTTTSPTLGRFIVTEAWVAVGEGVSDGVFAKVKDNGLRCITSPCPSVSEYALNASRTAAIAKIDYAAGDLSDAAVEGLVSDMTTGFIIAGDRFTYSFQGRSGKGRTATNAYRNVKNITAPAAQCFVGGCSGQICSDREGLVSTCEWRAEYACYADATCERQANGDCGWTQTEELTSCLASPPTI